MSQCFLSLSCEEFVVWLRTGSHKIYPGRLIDSYQENLIFPLSGPLAARIFEMLPSYESTSGVLIVQLTDPPIDSVGNSALHTLDSRHIGAVYAMSERNQRFLQQQLGTSYLLSTQMPLSENWVEKMAQHRTDDDARRGGRAVVEVLLGTDQPAHALEQVQWNTVVGTLEERDKGTLTKTSGDLVRSLFSYSRSGPISKEDIGFFQDLGLILKAVKSDIKSFGYSDEIKVWQKECPKAHLFELYRKIDGGPIPKSFDDNLKHPGGLLSSLVFLKLTRIVRETEKLTRDDLITTLGEFKDSKFYLPIIEGAWWCGVYWGFSRFSALFHDAICNKRSPILPETTTEPVTINAELVDSSLPSPALMAVETAVAITANRVLSDSATHDSTIGPAETLMPAPPAEQPKELITPSESAETLAPISTTDLVTSETVALPDEKGLAAPECQPESQTLEQSAAKDKQLGLLGVEQKQFSDASSEDSEFQKSPISDQITQQSSLEKINPPKTD